MNRLSPPIPLDDALAEGFSRQLMDLARASQAPAASVSLLGRTARAVSRATSVGHVCLSLDELIMPGEAAAREQARALLLDSGLVATEHSETLLPLVLDNEDRLYLGRYFDYERRLAAMLMARTVPLSAGIAVPGEGGALDFGFMSKAENRPERVDWQALAVAMALRNRLTIISGGPGTGKTTTVVHLLACLLAANPELRIALAAPTGKAAQRMQDAIRERAFHLPDHLRNLLPAEAYTIHRLLGVVADSNRFRHHAANPLPLDVLIVDEASMLDLALVAKLVQAVPGQARLILLGDKDQLSAVEAGAVFGEISCNPTISEACRQDLAALLGLPPAVIQPPSPARDSPLRDSTVWLTENYRFGQDSGIGRFAQAVNRQEISGALACLRGGQDGLRWVEDEGGPLTAESLALLVEGFTEYLHSIRQPGLDPGAVFSALGRFRVLCAVRDFERGVDFLNAQIGAGFRERLGHGRDDGRGSWYPGRPVMVLKNDYGLKLFNGDVGVTLPTVAGELMVHFPANNGRFRHIAPARLPAHETAFAMTVHKAQGSEFEEVAFVLPAHVSSVLSKELVYTAVTRSRRRLTLYSSEAVLAEAIGRQCVRNSGLISRMRPFV